MTVTQKKAYWVMPNAVRDVPYAAVKDIKFVKKKRSMQEIQTSKTLSTTTPTPSNSTSLAIGTCKESETAAFLASLSTCRTKPAILSIVESYTSNYIPKSLDDNLPLCLSKLYQSDCRYMNYGELLKVCEQCNFTVAQQQARAVEFNTKTQSKSPLWFSMKTGRITASRFKASSRTIPASPSISLIMAICYPEIGRFKNASTTWGCELERTARDKYISCSSINHQDLKVDESGLFICTEYSFIGASPDGLVTCSCCGDGICEIKVCL